MLYLTAKGSTVLYLLTGTMLEGYSEAFSAYVAPHTAFIREHGSVSLCRDGQKTKWRLQCKY